MTVPRPAPSAPRPALALSIALAAALGAGCGPRAGGERGAPPGAPPDTAVRPATAAEVAGFARAVEARLAELPGIEGRLATGDSDARFTAWFEGEHVRAVRESVAFGDYGRSELRWYFARDSLVLVTERGERSAAGRDGGGTMPVEMRLAFGPGGDTLEARRVLGGARQGFHPGWLLGILARAETLMVRARGIRASVSLAADTLLPTP